jgi:hypothetical protein
MPDKYGNPLPGEPAYEAVMGAILGFNTGQGGTAPPTVPSQVPITPPVTTYVQAQSTAPPGTDQQWWSDFEREHQGINPSDYYHGDLNKALYDKAWGEKYADLYKQPPDMYAWKDSYYDRARGYYGADGGGGGGGGYSASSTAATSLPSYYTNWFTTLFGAAPEAYYTQDRGGAQQMQYDYDALSQLWLNKTGRYLQPNEMQGLLTNALGYYRAQGSTPQFSDFLNYVDAAIKPVTAPQPVTYLQVGEI